MITFDLKDKGRKVKTFTHPTGFTVDIRGVTVAEFHAAARRYKDDDAGFNRHIAREWFIGFGGIFAPDGQPHENTQQVREALLDHPAINQFVSSKLQDFGAWLEEKNADSGSAS